MATTLNKVTRRLALAARVLRYGNIPGQGQTRAEIPAITPEEVAEARAFFPLDKFFIFGHARSGTTLLTRLVRLHPEVHCNYQAHFFTRPPTLQALVASEDVQAWLRRRSNRWNRGEDLTPVVLRAAADFILERDARHEGARIVGDKSPNSLLDGEAVRLMHKVYPDGRLVYIVRDGRDTALSHRFQAFIDFPEHLTKEDLDIRTDFTRDAEPYLRGKRSVFTEKGIRRAAESWVRNVTETDEMGKALFGDLYFSLRYEDLMEHPWEEMRRLWAFLGAEPDAAGLQAALTAELGKNPDADWQKQKAGEIAQPLQKAKRGSWQEMFTPQDQEIYQQIAGETLKGWGYST